MTATGTWPARWRRAIQVVAGASRAWRVLLTLLVLAVSVLALTPQPPPAIDLGWDKLNHLMAFASLAFAASLGRPLPLRSRLLWLGGLLAYGALVEILQQFVPGRSAEWGDLFADALGISLGAALAGMVLKSANAAAWREPSNSANRP